MEILETILPEIFLSISIMFLLLFGVFKKNSFKIVYKLTILILFFSILLVLNQINKNFLIFNDSFIVDDLSFYIKNLILISTIAVLLISKDYLSILKLDNFEYPILILSSVLGMFIMISSNDLIVFYMGLELQSLPLYVLATFNKKSIKSTEAGLKYFVLSALSSGLFLYGCSFIYGISGTTNFYFISSNLNSSDLGILLGIVFIIVALSFKISLVPFHMWTPDVYEGAPTSVTSFFALVPKVAGIGVFVRFMFVPLINVISEWQTILIFLSIASMILGSVAAIGQTNIKRLMAYSSIGHMGYALAGIATGTGQGIKSTIIYVTIYLIMNIGVFSCIFLMKRKKVYYENIADLSGLSKNHPLLSLSFLILLFSLAGAPPLAGFFAKFYIFMAVLEVKMYALAIIGLITTVISAFYYLRIIKIIYFDKPLEVFDVNKNFGIKFTLTISTIFIFIYFLKPSFLIKAANSINIF